MGPLKNSDSELDSLPTCRTLPNYLWMTWFCAAKKFIWSRFSFFSVSTLSFDLIVSHLGESLVFSEGYVVNTLTGFATLHDLHWRLLVIAVLLIDRFLVLAGKQRESVWARLCHLRPDGRSAMSLPSGPRTVSFEWQTTPACRRCRLQWRQSLPQTRWAMWGCRVAAASTGWGWCPRTPAFDRSAGRRCWYDPCTS